MTKEVKYHQNLKMLEIDVKFLERIAEYYEFPVAVFFSPTTLKDKPKTRNKVWQKKAEKYDKIIEIIKENYDSLPLMDKLTPRGEK